MKSSLKSLGLIIFSIGLLLSGCTLDGGASKPTTGNGKSVENSVEVKVTGVANSEPQIEAPRGSAPTKLVSKDIFHGTGATVSPNSTLTVHYKLMTWSDGKIVDSSWKSGKPATFPLAQVIQGWQQGLPGMKVGGRRLLVIPPDLGYGSTGAGPIKANETLIFVVDLIASK